MHVYLGPIKLIRKLIENWIINLLNYKYLIKLIIKINKNNKIMIYLKKIIKKLNKYIKNKKFKN